MKLFLRHNFLFISKTKCVRNQSHDDPLKILKSQEKKPITYIFNSSSGNRIYRKKNRNFLMMSSIKLDEI